MSWFSKNKFIAGLLGVTLLGAGGLGFMLFTAKGAYEENASTFEQQATELSRLEHLPAYPDQQNYQALEQQRLAHLDAIDQLQKQLAGAQIPTEQLTPVQFQDRLKTAVTDVTRDAAAAHLVLPAKTGFYLGFEPYSTAPPTPEAAPLLGRQLKSIQLIMAELMKNGVTQLQSFNRETLPEENPAKAQAEAAKAAAGKGKAATSSPASLKKQHIDLAFRTEQGSAQKVLNGLASSPSQFFIIRYLTIENEQKAGPSKIVAPSALVGGGAGAPIGQPANGDSESQPVPMTVAPGAAAPGADPAAPAGSAPELKNPVVVGEERVIASLRLEIVDIPEPEVSAPKAGRNAAK